LGRPIYGTGVAGGPGGGNTSLPNPNTPFDGSPQPYTSASEVNAKE